MRLVEQDEWIEADGLGSFASGTVTLLRNRRYHALLLIATRPPAGRMVLVNGLEAWVETPSGRYALSSQRYAGDVTYPDGTNYIIAFHARPWPLWSFELPDGTCVEYGIVVAPGRSSTLLYWRLTRGTSAILTVRLLMSGRDYHSLNHENPTLNSKPEMITSRVTVRPYAGVPAIVFDTNASSCTGPIGIVIFFMGAKENAVWIFIEDLARLGHKLGARYFHFDARPMSGNRSPRRSTSNSDRMVHRRIRVDASQPISRCKRTAAAALRESPDLSNFKGRVSDSGEGRWTLQTAIDEGIPAPVISAALYARFSSRGDEEYADRLLSAMRYEFGGHLEKPKTGGH